LMNPFFSDIFRNNTLKQRLCRPPGQSLPQAKH
jgi:hypothetical protein